VHNQVVQLSYHRLLDDANSCFDHLLQYFGPRLGLRAKQNVRCCTTILVHHHLDYAGHYFGEWMLVAEFVMLSDPPATHQQLLTAKTPVHGHTLQNAVEDVHGFFEAPWSVIKAQLG
jgi:hypothetical protein